MSAIILNSCAMKKSEVPAPSKEYYDSVVKELSSAEYYGRSNYMDGSVKAAKFILGEIQGLGVKPIPQEVIAKAWEGKQRPELHSLQPEFKSEIVPSDAGRWSNGTEAELSYMQHFSHPLNAQRGAVELIVDGKKLVNTVDYTAHLPFYRFYDICKSEGEEIVLQLVSIIGAYGRNVVCNGHCAL